MAAEQHKLFFSISFSECVSECLCNRYTMHLHNFEGTSLALYLPKVPTALPSVTKGDTIVTYGDTSKMRFMRSYNICQGIEAHTHCNTIAL